MDALLATARLYVTAYPEAVFIACGLTLALGLFRGSPLLMGLGIASTFMAYILMGGF